MLTLDKKSAEIFNIVLGMCDKNENRFIKIDNSKGAFMPLSVEFLYSLGKYSVYSFSHYYKQNGDMCPDPDMTFFVETKEPKIIIPMDYDDKTLKAFLKEGGQDKVTPVDKLTIKAKDIIGREGEIVVLSS